MRVAAGYYLNAINQAVTPLVGVVSTMDTYYPAVNMYDRRADLRARWSAADGSFDEKIMFDLNMVPFGNCDALTGWTMQTGTSLTLNAATKIDGTNSIQLSHNANAVAVGTPFKIRAGQLIAFNVSVRCTVGGAAPKGVTLVLRNMVTGKVWHQPNNTWIAAASMDYNNGYVDRSAADAWVTLTGTITMESFLACGLVDACDCRLEMHVWSSGGTTVTGLFDALYLFPSVDLVAIFGYNGTVENLPAWYISPDGTWGSAAKVFDLAPAGQDVMWKQNATTPFRYHGIWIPNNNALAQVEPMREIGELIFATTTLLSPAPLYPIKQDLKMPAYRAVSPTLQPYVSPLIGSATPPRRMVFSFEVGTLTDGQQIRDEFYLRSACGRDPIVFMPTEAEDIVLYGYVPVDLTITQTVFGNWAVEIDFQESPLF